MLKNQIRHLLLTRLRSYQCRLFSTKEFPTECKDEITPIKKKKKIKEPSPGSKDVLKHFSQSGREIALNYPPELLKRYNKKHSIESFYLSDKSAVDIIFKALTKDLPDDTDLYEINPGVGLLTERLINETKNKLTLFETDKPLKEKLEATVEAHPEREIELRHVNYISLWKLEFLDKFDNGDRTSAIFRGMKRAKYYEEPVARIFGCVGSTSFFRDLINAVVFQNSFMLHGRPEYFLCLPPSVYMQLTCSPSVGYFLYRQIAVLFQIFFEYEFIAQINRKSFLPWISTSIRFPRKEKYLKLDKDFMFLVRIVPRQDLFNHILPSQLTALWYFMKQHMISRSKPIIPTMERWVPGCGPRLIVNAKPPKRPEILFPNEDTSLLPDYYAPAKSLTAQDYADNIQVFTQFGMLSPVQLFTIFNQFIHWPEYSNCAFNDMLEKYLERIFSNPEDVHENDSDNEEEIEVPENEEQKV